MFFLLFMEIIEQQNIPNDVQNEQPLQPPEKKKKQWLKENINLD